MKNRLDYNVISWNELVYYDETSPSCLRWKINSHRRGAKYSEGDIVGTKMKMGYFKVGVGNHEYYCHRVVWILHNGYIDNCMTIDHYDRDISNNKIDNLRLVYQKINSRNTKLSKNNTSGITGVSFSSSRNTWQAYINGVNGREIKNFCVSIYGYDEAFKMACEYRKFLLEKHNALGAHYSEAHGT